MEAGGWSTSDEGTDNGDTDDIFPGADMHENSIISDCEEALNHFTMDKAASAILAGFPVFKRTALDHEQKFITPQEATAVKGFVRWLIRKCTEGSLGPLAKQAEIMAKELRKFMPAMARHWYVVKKQEEEDRKENKPRNENKSVQRYFYFKHLSTIDWLRRVLDEDNFSLSGYSEPTLPPLMEQLVNNLIEERVKWSQDSKRRSFK
eukprot:1909667-Rhodomonas_salina.1